MNSYTVKVIEQRTYKTVLQAVDADAAEHKALELYNANLDVFTQQDKRFVSAEATPIFREETRLQKAKSIAKQIAEALEDETGEDVKVVIIGGEELL